MDAQAAALLSTLKRPATPSEQKLNALNALKSDIKHCRVPETAQSTIFECLRLAISQQVSSNIALSAFSTLGHLVKRLRIQDATGHAVTQLGPRLLPALQERLGDLKEAIRHASSQALSELYPFLPQDVEILIREEAIGGSNARAKEAGMQWVLRMHCDESMPFKSYTSAIVARLEDADGAVRDAAKTVLVELFKNAPERAKTDLKRQLKAHSVRHAIASNIISQIGAEGSSAAASRPQTRGDPEPDSIDMVASTRSLPSFDHAAHFADSIASESMQAPPQDVVPMDPLFVQSERELNEIFRDMQPCFEGKEDEDNWVRRDKSVLKLRRLLKGNAPNEYHHAFMTGIKSVMDGIIKVANSLRTTMSTNGSQLVNELARTLGPALDPHVEILLQNFIKMSSQTKPIAAQNGRVTCDAIFQNCSYNKGMMQHIWHAAQEKNVQLRQCVPEWLRTILKRQAGYKQHFDSSGGLELAEKTIKKGLEDPKPNVKLEMRATYWTFARSWPDRAEKIMAGLDNAAKTALQKDPNNPNASLHTSQMSATAAVSRPGGHSRIGMREMIAEQRKAKAAGRLPERPNSAMAQLSPAKSRSHSNLNSATRGSSHLRAENRIPSTASTVSETPTEGKTAKRSALMSGPVRRPRRPELTRPQTADPYASKRLLRPETPANGTPSNSPPKGTAGSKVAIPTSSVIRNRSKTSGTQASPSGSPRPGLGQTTSVDSSIPVAYEDDGFTMVLPNMAGNAGRARSPLSYRSPLKAMFEEARDKLERSASPPCDRITGIDEAIGAATAPQRANAVKMAISQSEDIHIYEDPFTADREGALVAGERQVLGELQVNENVQVHSPTQSLGSSASPAGSPRQGGNASAAIPGTPQDRAEVLRNRRLLTSGIERIRTRTIDAHGFRRVQDLARCKLDIWEGGKKYDELMTVLLEYLQGFDQDTGLTQQPQKAAGLRLQALGTVRTLLAAQRKSAQAWQHKSLITLFVCRQGVENNSHVIADLEKVATQIVQQAQPEPCIDATLEYLPTVGSNRGASRSVAMALSILRRLLESAKSRSVDLGSERKVRLTQATAKYLDDADAEVRKADVELASDLFELFGSSKTEFWSEFKGTDEGRLGLLTYYIARRGKAGMAQ
ncbi:hypothetical protein M433DRAFT_166849 [Acidomyces richmondensis BFW]|nr:MAG: hypothetical protein FE78DRAFT_108968 [Acidomyces sp. 'richmondensis']KYG44619.1 hypothetical protein M433DRAFT_166849 [Acidomyces richmondensis BFW]